LNDVKEMRQPVLSQSDKERMKKAKYFFKFATAACGWPIYAAHKGFASVCCNLGCKVSRCCQGMDAEQEEHIRYNSCCCRLSLPAFVDYAGIPPEDVILANISTDIDQVVYYVCFDRKTKSVVVAVRGTLSAQDAITDSRQKYTSFPLPPSLQSEECKESTCAEGFKRVCERIVADLLNCPRLHRILDTEKDASIIVTGHSLGGAISSLLPFFLLNKPQFQNRKVLAYPMAPPPTVPRALANMPRVRKMVTSVVYQDDVVPRLSVHNLSKLRFQIIHELSRAKGQSIRALMNEGIKEGSDQVDVVETKALIDYDSRNEDPLHIVGTIFHMKTELTAMCEGACVGCYQLCCCPFRGMVAPRGTYRTICYKATSDTFQEVIIAAQMTHEHLPSSYERAFQDLFFE